MRRGTHTRAEDCGSRMISDFEKININKYIPSILLRGEMAKRKNFPGIKMLKHPQRNLQETPWKVSGMREVRASAPLRGTGRAGAPGGSRRHLRVLITQCGELGAHGWA